MTRLLTSKFSLLSAAALMLGAPQMASAQSASALSGLYACEAISDISAQLACFRAETAKLRAADPSVSSAPSVSSTPSLSSTSLSSTSGAVIERRSLTAAPVARAPSSSSLPAAQPAEIKQAEITKPVLKESEDENFGLTKKEPPKEIESRTLTVASTERWGPSRLIRFTMENGEVWQQTDAKSIRVGKGNPDVISIKKARLGSFVARLNDKKPAFRVKRLK